MIIAKIVANVSNSNQKYRYVVHDISNGGVRRFSTDVKNDSKNADVLSSVSDVKSENVSKVKELDIKISDKKNVEDVASVHTPEKTESRKDISKQVNLPKVQTGKDAPVLNIAPDINTSTRLSTADEQIENPMRGLRQSYRSLGDVHSRNANYN